jgi:DNA invertase Pin-like site-specific DNA recombinase
MVLSMDRQAAAALDRDGRGATGAPAARPETRCTACGPPFSRSPSTWTQATSGFSRMTAQRYLLRWFEKTGSQLGSVDARRLPASRSRALARLRAGDVFVVAEWDRATRSMMDGLHLMTQIHARGATIRVLDRNSLDLTTPTGRAVLGLLSAIYEEERTRIVARAKQGLENARRNGVRFGPKPKLSAADAAHALQLIREGASYRQAARALDVHHVTIARLAKRSFAGPP